MKAFYQANERGIPDNSNIYTAYDGFLQRGAEVLPFTIEEMRAGKVPLERDTPVAGSIRSVRHAWNLLGVGVPETLDYPASLLPYTERRIWPTTCQAIADELHASDYQTPIFVKPRKLGKAFKGTVLREQKDLTEIVHFPPDFPLWASDVLDWLSEWRVYVIRGEMLDSRSYKGNSFHSPDEARVREMVAVFEADKGFAGGTPAAYSLDVGVTTDGRTALVEASDSYALGAYGLVPFQYARLIANRWFQVCGLPLPSGW